MKTITLAAGAASLALLAGACQIDVERNADGSLQVGAAISEADIATELTQVMQTREGQLSVDLRDGYAVVTATGPTSQFPHTESFTFELELFVENDHLGASVDEVDWNGEPLPEGMIEAWNADLAARLEADATRHPNTKLEEVVITDDEVRLDVRIETPRSLAN